MAGTDNLIPADKRSKEELREMTSKGGKASGKARRKKKELRECLEILLNRKYETDGKELTGSEIMSVTAIKAAMGGDWKAWELVRDTAGQKPVEKLIMAEVDPETVKLVEDLVLEDVTPDDA
jgi:hypothetical protein